MTNETRAKVKELFENTDMTLKEIAEAVGYKSYTYLYTSCIKGQYSEKFIQERKSKNYRKARELYGNSMKQLTGTNHPRYKGQVVDGHGYIMILKPEWYTGRKGSKYVYLHSVVMCEALGLTEIPKGFIVHHIDENPTNNDLSNLALMRMEAHSRLHHSLRRCRDYSARK